MSEIEPKRTWQFSLRALLIIITVACIVLAIPGGFILLAMGLLWFFVLSVITWVLMIFRAPIYRFLAGIKPGEKLN